MGIYLSKPNLIKLSHNDENSILRYGISAMQGWRMNMEDAHITNLEIAPGVSLFAVFDGHGGPEIAKFCAKYFTSELLKNENFVSKAYKFALEEVFIKMDCILMSENGLDLIKEFKNEPEGNVYSGCTANVLLITKNEIYCANAGDSRSYVYSKMGTLTPLSTDHKPDVEVERKRIESAGGYINDGRVNDNLNLTRAIGDLEYKKNPALKPECQIISAFPDVVVKTIDNTESFALVGCDGIWETLSALDICKIVETKLAAKKDATLSTICEELLDRLVAKETMDGTGCDNMSLILIQFRQ
jgi:serine/threonine protein phosphatase PrpC